MNPNERLEAIEKIIRETEKKIDALTEEESRSAMNIYALGYQKIKQLVEDDKESAEDG